MTLEVRKAIDDPFYLWRFVNYKSEFAIIDKWGLVRRMVSKGISK